MSVCGFVGAILSRIEVAARYMLITQTCLTISQNGLDIDRRRISEFLAQVAVSDETDVSLSECRARLKAVRAVLMNLPRHALRLLRRIEKLMGHADEIAVHPHPVVAASLRDQHPAKIRIERPPDKGYPHHRSFNLPPNYRARGVGGPAIDLNPLRA